MPHRHRRAAGRVIATRMTKVPTALEQYRRVAAPPPRPGQRRPAPPGRRRASSSARTSPPTTATSPRSSPGATAGGAAARRAEPPAALAAAVAAAADAYARARRVPAHASCSTAAPEADACGRERYPLVSRYFLGAAVDLEETYALGPGGAGPDHRRDGGRGRADQARRHASRRPSTLLDADPAYQLHGTDALRGVDAGQGRRGHRRAGRHATSTSPSRCARIECMIAPTHTGRHLLHRPERGLQPARAGCGGRCPRASPSSAPGAS